MHMRRVVHGMKRLVRLQLQEVTWRCSDMQERMDALGMNRLILLHIHFVV